MKRFGLQHFYQKLSRVLQLSTAQQKTAAALSLVLLVGAAAVVLCCFIEDTINLDDGGKGLAVHYGIWAIFISSPLLVVFGYAVYSEFLNALTSLSKYTVGDSLPKALEDKVEKHRDSLHLKTSTRYNLWAFIVVGWLCWLLNIKQTIYPFDSYGNDVFDAYPHLLGFISFKLYLGVLWVLVYPALSFLAAHIFISLTSILRYMGKEELFRLDFFHEDNCGGVSIFGWINLLLLGMTFIVFSTVMAILMTHEGNYATIWSAVVLSLALIIIQSVTGVYSIHMFVQRKKREVLSKLNKFLNDALLADDEHQSFPQEFLAVRDHIAQIRSFPYTKSARIFVNTIRLSPAAVGLMQIIRGI